MIDLTKGTPDRGFLQHGDSNVELLRTDKVLVVKRKLNGSTCSYYNLYTKEKFLGFINYWSFCKYSLRGDLTDQEAVDILAPKNWR